MKYPAVLTEEETLERAIGGASLARYGDGELRIAVGGACTSQRADPALTAELAAILKAPGDVLACIPNAISKTPKAESWAKYAHPRFTALYGAKTYGSAFISRPDSAPWIDVPAYWDRVKDLWRGQDVVLATGHHNGIREEGLTEAKSVRVVSAPRQHAYAEIDRIEAEIGTPSGPVLMCLGATATALAARLARKGVHALDLGHLGMFMRHAGAYRYVVEDLASAGYRKQLARLHAGQRWGADGAKHLAPVLAYADALQADTVLDYGCGEGKLSEAAAAVRRIQNYDPGIPGREGMPKPVDLVVCTDVLEHVEPGKLDAVLDHIRRLAAKGAYLVIATRPAKAMLPDGRNAHLIVQPAEWWLDKLGAMGWIVERADHKPGHDLTCWVRA
jgi:hypothetical protein